MPANLGYNQEGITARRAALTDRSGVVAGAGIVHDEHRLLVEIQMKVSLREYEFSFIMILNNNKTNSGAQNYICTVLSEDCD